MTFLHKKIPLMDKSFKNIKSNILIIGGGRWATITVRELLTNFTNLAYIQIITKKKNLIKDFPEKLKKKIIISKNFKNIIFDKLTHAIVVNKNSDHFSYTKKILNNKMNVLVEKPLVKKISEFKILKKISQKNKKFIHVSIPFFFSYYFFYIKKFINFHFEELIFDWHDPCNDNRYGKLKKYDLSVTYLEDTIYHIYGILNCLFGPRKISFISSKNRKNEGVLVFDYGKDRIRVICSRNIKKKRVRKLNFVSTKNTLNLNYSNDQNIYFIKNGIKKRIKFNFSQKSLKYQLYNFLSNKKYEKKYHLNDIRNFDNLFYLIKAFKKN
tara:strand:+ start:2057 stop:3031 length:975 start_codon:yes stop_codon:yes gene_type:complete